MPARRACDGCGNQTPARELVRKGRKDRGTRGEYCPACRSEMNHRRRRNAA